MKESQFHCNSVIIPISRVIIPGAYKRTFVFFFYRLKYVYKHHINAIIALQSVAYLSCRV